MATKKNTDAKAPKAAPQKKPAPQKVAAKGKGMAARMIDEKSKDELMAENITALSKVVESLEVTLEMLVQKVAGMAHHVIATEEILAEVVATTGLNLALVNARIRAKIAAGTDNIGNSNPAIDIAASIASPLPLR